MREESSFRLYEVPALTGSTLIVSWDEDAGELGTEVIDNLIRKLACRELGEILPTGFFPLAGVTVEDNVAGFPESKFYYCPEKEMVLFRSSSPRSEWYRFLETVLDVAVSYCHVREIYTLGGMISLAPHTVPREVMTVVNEPGLKTRLASPGVNTTMDFETPPGQRPTISSFLLWAAEKRGIPAVSLWVPMPFYLVPVSDPEAWRQTLDFFNRRFGLGLNLTDLDELITEQSKKITGARMEFPELDSYLTRLESNISLSEEENEKLMRQMVRILAAE